jgi:prolyl-tRNA synthetase
MVKQEGIAVKKSENFSRWYTQVIQKAELADIRYNVKGFLVHQPWSVKIMKKMQEFIEKELEARGHEPFLFPSVIPESFLRKEKEHAEFSANVFWITEAGEKFEKMEKKLALRPTSETAIYSMFSLWIRSWRDLPMKTYQACQVWRYESYTRPFIRGREFYWIEAHNAFASKEEAEKQVKEDMEITENTLHKQFCIPFLFFKRPEHDKFKGAVSTFAADTIMPDGKVLQLPSTHFLGQKFSKAFNIRFTDKDKKEKYVWQTCYGHATWRVLGALIAIHGDDKGLVIPPSISPYQAVIIPIYYTEKEKEKIFNKIKTLKKKLKIRCYADLREEHTPGWKFNYWELKGVPVRIEIGPKDLKKKQIILFRRDLRKREVVKEKDLKKRIEFLLKDIQDNLRKKADSFFSQNLS